MKILVKWIHKMISKQLTFDCKVTSIEVSRFQRHGKLATKIRVPKELL